MFVRAGLLLWLVLGVGCAHVGIDVQQSIPTPYQIQGKLTLKSGDEETRLNFKKMASEDWQWFLISSSIGKPLWVMEFVRDQKRLTTLQVLDAVKGCRARVDHIYFLGQRWTPAETELLLSMDHHRVADVFVKKLTGQKIYFHFERYRSPMYRTWTYESPSVQLKIQVQRFETLLRDDLEDIRNKFSQQKSEKFDEVSQSVINWDSSSPHLCP